MKSYLKLLGVTGVMLVANGTAVAQSNTTLNAYARIIRPIHISTEEEINFGAVYSPTANGTAMITPNHSFLSEDPALRHLTGLVGISNNQPHGVDNSADLDDHDGIEQGQVMVTGEAGFAYTVSSTGGTMTDGASHTMAIDKVTYDPAPGFLAPIGVLTGNATHFSALPGFQILNVGATLHVNGGQQAGIYHGTITVQAAYN